MNINEKSVVFVGGVHGVGKGTLCERLSSYFDIPHLSAGELIRQYKRANQTQNKEVHDVQGNQDVLISALCALQMDSGACLLDGHFCLIGSDEQIRQVPLETFQRLNPAAVVVLQDIVERIFGRLSNRDGKQYALSMLTSLQNSEINTAKIVCDKLDIPLLVSVPEKIEDIIQFVQGRLNFPPKL